MNDCQQKDGIVAQLPHDDSSVVQWISADDDLFSRMVFFDEFVNSFCTVNTF